MENKGHREIINSSHGRERDARNYDFVLEKSIFSNIFEKDIRRVYIYKKAERLAKAIHLITPAFTLSSSLRNRIDAIAVGLIDAAILTPAIAKNALSHELLALSSVLSIARSGGLLSSMNAELISREAHQLLQEVAAYEEPRLFLDDTPSLAHLVREAGKEGISKKITPKQSRTPQQIGGANKGQKESLKDNSQGRRESIISIVKDKQTVYIKDISTIIRGVSEKTIQRELHKLVEEGLLSKTGSRRWTAYTIAGSL